MKRGDQVGPWTLRSPLGHGGNADVWRAAGEDGSEVALKILRARRRDSERWQRFRREVDAHLELRDVAGVLPLIAADLPEDPRERGWLAMPVATPLNEWLFGEDLSIIVEAIAGVSDALARLADRGIAHRDVKPANLYRYGESTVVGDLGLLDLPGAETLTGAAGIRGSAHFVAYEVYRGGDEDARPGDVYALAKTLWVLSTGQNFPPPGHQPAESPVVAIGSYTIDRYTNELDRIIERATLLDPALRPTMLEFGDDLRAWVRLEEDEGHPPDLSRASARLRRVIAPQLQAQEQERVRIASYGDAVTYARERLAGLVAAVTDAFPNAYETDSPEEIFQIFPSPQGMGLPQTVGSFGYGAAVRVGDVLPISLVSGIYIEVHDDGNLNLGAAHIVGRQTVGGLAVPWSDRRTTRAGSTRQRLEIDELVRGLYDSLELLLTNLFVLSRTTLVRA